MLSIDTEYSNVEVIISREPECIQNEYDRSFISYQFQINFLLLETSNYVKSDTPDLMNWIVIPSKTNEFQCLVLVLGLGTNGLTRVLIQARPNTIKKIMINLLTKTLKDNASFGNFLVFSTLDSNKASMFMQDTRYFRQDH